MFSALWDLFTCAARALFDLGGAVVRLAFQLLSALAGAVLWPLRALWALLFGDWSALATWTPGYLVGVLPGAGSPGRAAALQPVEEGKAVRAKAPPSPVGFCPEGSYRVDREKREPAGQDRQGFGDTGNPRPAQVPITTEKVAATLHQRAATFLRF